jgi:hypothetical protein
VSQPYGSSRPVIGTSLPLPVVLLLLPNVQAKLIPEMTFLTEAVTVHMDQHHVLKILVHVIFVNFLWGLLNKGRMVGRQMNDCKRFTIEVVEAYSNIIPEVTWKDR